MNTQINEPIELEPTALEQTNVYANLIISSVLEGSFTILLNAFFWAFIGFILCIIVLIILKKKKLFKRDNKLWHILSMLQYPAWLVIFVSAGLSIGVVRGVESKAQSAFDEHAEPYIQSMTPIINQYLMESIPELSINEPTNIRTTIINTVF